jgi:hypothetical protein
MVRRSFPPTLAPAFAAALTALALLFARPGSTRAARRAPAHALADAPMRFEQAAGRDRFVARGRGYGVFVDAGSVVLADEGAGALRMRAAGASRAARVEAERPLPGYSNYLKGRDPSRWRMRVPGFAAVRCRDLYPGVDLVCYGEGGRFEYDFVVAPHADARAIRLALDGATRVRVEPGGDLAVETAAGEVRHLAPSVYQETAAGRARVAGRFVARGAGVGFELGAYDPDLPLVVDPQVEFTKEFGGGGYDWGVSVAVDPSGNVYLGANTLSDDFPTVAAFQSEIGGGLYYEQDAIVAKLDPSGQQILYATYFGGSNLDNANAIAVDASGSVVVAGYTQSADFPTHNPIQPALSPPGDPYNPSTDVFVARFTADGSALVYSTYLGGSGLDYGNGVALDAAGNAYVTGSTRSGRPDPDGDEPPTTPFPTTPGAFQTTLLPSEAAGGFVTKINPDGSALVYSTYVEDPGVGIAVDGDGNAYTCGDDTLHARARVRKVNAAGSALVYSFSFDGHPAAIALDGSLQAVVAGTTPAFVPPGSAAETAPPDATGYPHEERNVFVTKLNAAGNGFVYSLLFGEARANDFGNGVAADAAGNAYVVGDSTSASFPVVNPLPNAPPTGAFVMKIDPSGAVVFSSRLFVDYTTSNQGVTANGMGDMFVTGKSTEQYSYDYNPFAVKISTGGAAAARSDTPGVCASSNGWFLRDSNTAGPADLTFSFGPSGVEWVPLSGDWNGDGICTPGLYDPANGVFFLRNANAGGPADLAFSYGPPNLMPIAGDWDGNGTDTVGLYDPATGNFFLKNSNGPGAADVVFTFGAGGVGIVPVAGDWDGNGRDTVGLYNRNTATFFLKNSNAPGPADRVFGYGPVDMTPIAGDWDGDGVDTIGVYSTPAGAWFLRNSNTPGPANVTFAYGPSNVTPVTGYWEAR